MGQAGIMSDEQIGASDDSGHQLKIECVQYTKLVRAELLKLGDLLHVGWTADDQRYGASVPIPLNDICGAICGYTFISASASRMNDDQWMNS